MKRITGILTAVFFLITLIPLGCSAEERGSSDKRLSVKEPAVAGIFYPAEKKALGEMVDTFLSVPPKVSHSGRLIGLISPHAGYQFSGQVAAYAYNQLKGKDISTVIVIGSSHHVSFKGASVYAKGRFRTPLGDVWVDEYLAGRLLSEKDHVLFDPDVFAKEHSIEVQIPFLQRTLKEFRIVPILTGSLTKESFNSLTENLARILIEKKNAIIVASTDLSHYHDAETAKLMDKRVIGAIENLSVEELNTHYVKGTGELCGAQAVIVTMVVAKGVGANRAKLLKYVHSGDVTGDMSHVVGYAAIGIYRTDLTREEKDELLHIARKTIEGYVGTGKTPSFEVKHTALKLNGAVFVTIKRHGNLRGCIGHILPIMPLYQSVINNAVAASSSDPRFSPLKKEELKDLEVEVSVLSLLEPVKDAKTIRVGTHGLYIVKGKKSGLLLPQVAEENKWDRDTFLEQVCVKASLPKDAWKDAELYTFTAEIIK